MAECLLGCPDTRVYLLDHCGRSVLGDLTDSVSFTKYDRKLSDDSELEVSLHLKGDAVGRACCELLENTRTWRNELLVVRGDEPAWGPGPLVTMQLQHEIVHLVSRDIIAWLDVRLVHADYSFVDVDLTTIARTVIVDALTTGDALHLPPDVRDACILHYATFTPSGKTASLEVTANKQSAGEILRSLATKGLDFTVLRRSLIVGADFAWGPVGPLRDEHFLTDLEISEHGLAAATSWRVSNSTLTGTAGGEDGFFGLIERAVEDAESTSTQAELDRQAAERVSATNPPPLTVNVPSGAQLAPTAPVCTETLVPGTLVDLAVTGMCRGVQTRQRVTNVEFNSDETGEKVSVTIAPLGNAQIEQEA